MLEQESQEEKRQQEATAASGNRGEGQQVKVKAQEGRGEEGQAVAASQEQVQPRILPYIPIIIPVYGNLPYLERCLLAIERVSTLPYRLILVDDCSPAGEDLGEGWVRELQAQGFLSGPHPPATFAVIRHRSNAGYTQAVNTGIRFAHDSRREFPWDWLVLLNTDTEPLGGWLEAFQETVSHATGVGIVGAKLLSMDNPDQIIHGGTLDLMGTHRGGRESQGHCNKRLEQVWVTFACVAITRECLTECGLLDRGFLHFCSDSGYCLVARSRGFRVIYQPRCRVLHKQSATVSRVVDQRKLQADQQRLLNLWGGAQLKEWANELPQGILRGQGR